MKICFLERNEIKTFNGNRAATLAVTIFDTIPKPAITLSNNLAVTRLRKRYRELF